MPPSLGAVKSFVHLPLTRMLWRSLPRESTLIRPGVCFAVHHPRMSSQSWGSRASYLEYPDLTPHPIKHTHPVDGDILLRQQFDRLLRHHSTRYGADAV